jgi:hypothetical protein
MSAPAPTHSFFRLEPTVRLSCGAGASAARALDSPLNDRRFARELVEGHG